MIEETIEQTLPEDYFSARTFINSEGEQVARLPPRGNLNAELMLILAYPTITDFETGALMSSDYFVEVESALYYAGISLDNVYITSVLKTGLGKKGKLSAKEIAHQRPTLEAEIARVKPKLIMSLGAEVFKWLMKANMTQSGFFGEVVDCPYGKLIANYSPGMILMQDPKKRPAFEDAFQLAGRFLTDRMDYTPFTWEVVTDVQRSIELLLGYINKGAETNEPIPVGYDAEWVVGDMHSGEEVLVTFQYCCEPHHAILLDIAPDLKTENLELLNTMKLLLENPRVRRMGWNVRADDKRLLYRGFQLDEHTLAYDGMKAVAFFDSRYPKSLETGIRKFTDYEPYYMSLNKALREHKLKPEELTQMRLLSPDVYWKYCAGDAVAHYTACMAMKQKMEEVVPAPAKEFYYKTYLPLSNYFMDMEMFGLPIDVEVMEEITEKYATRYSELLAELTDLVKDIIPDFNPASAPQKKALLYEHLKLDPPFYTKSGKSPKPRVWYMRQKATVQADYSPSCNGKSLSTLKFELTTAVNSGQGDDGLAHKLLIVSTLLALNRVSVFANKFLSKRGLSEDEEDEDDGEPLKQSYWAAMSKDKHIHADFFECLNNFRSSSRPNVQNPASKVLSHIPDIFVPGYSSLPKEERKAHDHKIPRNVRHIFYPGDPNFAFAEVDVAGADLAIAAFLSKDPDYISDILRGGFHLTKAREYFQDPTIQKDNYSKYVSSKAITFRVAYTSELLSAATPIQAEIFAESGIFVPIKDVQYALSTWHRYRRYMQYREECKAQIKEYGVIENARGLKFSFGHSDKFGILASWQNESLAFPIASELALFLWDVSVSIKEQFKKDNIWMRYVKPVNSVHDALYWVIHKDLLKDNYFPEVAKAYFTDICKLATGDKLGMEMVVSDRWKGKEEFFSNETTWNFDKKCWEWKA